MNERPFLKLVHNRDPEGKPLETTGHFEPIQASLIASGQRSLIVCTTDGLDEQSFIEVVEQTNSRVALDLRVAPRFDFGSLNRRKVLALFEGGGVRYIDLGIQCHSGETLFDAFNRALEDKALIECLKNDTLPITVLMFIDPTPDYTELGFRLVRDFRKITGLDWELLIYGPPDAPTTIGRDVIFISHANPEDNEFVLWLQAQLTRHGYLVWSDLTALKAGETFWETIEDVIRKRATKVLVVASKAAMVKPNVLDEISLAISIERSEKIANFVIPLRIDLPFTDFRANIARKNSVDYSQSWSRGFVQLIDTLKREGIPRAGGFPGSELETWWERRRSARSKIENTPEILVSNQFLIDSLPALLFILEGTPTFDDNVSVTSSFRTLPLVRHQSSWLSFLTNEELSRCGLHGLEIASTAATSEILTGNVRLVQNLRPYERQRLLHALLNRQWEWFLAQKGLLQYRPAAGSPPMALYFPHGLLDKDQVEFMDMYGVSRRRKLTGYSEKRKLYWHLGLGARFVGESRLLMKLRLKVIFTEDGASETIATNRQQDLRRRFCKNWWNDRWQGLQSGAMAWLASGASSVPIHEGRSGRLSISSIGQTFISPVSIRDEILNLPEIDTEINEYDNLLNDEDDVDVDFDTIDATGETM